MRHARRLPAALTALVIASCADPMGPAVAPPLIATLPRQLTATEQEMVTAVNGFGFELLRQVDATFADSNVFLSPLSASMALGLDMNGAEGTTFKQMRSTLGFGPRTHDELNATYQSLIALLRGLDSHVTFEIANGIFYADGFGPRIEPTFLSDANEYFDAAAEGLDFGSPQAVSTVNDWAKQHTHGRIPSIINAIDSDVVVLVLDAIWFKGDWRNGFKTNDTHALPFTTAQGSVVDVPTMTRHGGFRTAIQGGTMVIELPYGGDAFVMDILLPPLGTTPDGLLATLTPDSWNDLTADLRTLDTDLFLPKFTLAWGDTLNDELQQMGMVQPFVPLAADFSRMSRSDGHLIYISNVIQKAWVDINETGTEAAAVTVVENPDVSRTLPIHIDRPFLFAIRERLSGTILFLGKVLDPTRRP